MKVTREMSLAGLHEAHLQCEHCQCRQSDCGDAEDRTGQGTFYRRSFDGNARSSEIEPRAQITVNSLVQTDAVTSSFFRRFWSAHASVHEDADIDAVLAEAGVSQAAALKEV